LKRFACQRHITSERCPDANAGFGGVGHKERKRAMSRNTVLVHEKTADLPSHCLSFLIVAAERGVRDMCKEVAEEMGFRVRAVESTAAALRTIETHPVDLVLLDWRLAGAEGMDLLLKLRHDHPQTEVAILTANATADFVLTAMKFGAFDFLRKPFYLGELRTLLERAADHLQASVESRVAREALRGNTAGPCLIGRSREMEKLHRIIAKVAPGQVKKWWPAPSMPAVRTAINRLFL
jgi:FixJ family two-component response regulator